MVAFAIGGLLGDTLLHLIPGSFLGGEEEGGGSAGHGHGVVEFVIKNDRRNLLIGGMIMVGFVVFVAMDKALRVAGMGAGVGKHGGHGHSHGHSTTAHSHSQGGGTGTGADGTVKGPPGELRKRKGGDGAIKGAPEQKQGQGEDQEVEEKQHIQEVKMSSYLNIIADV